jgi:S1-C subfamily serine protease
MSVESSESPETPVPALRREALLPNERGRGLGTVAIVCTMAGVASGLALATTLMAMQVADSMSVRTCPYRVIQQAEPIEARSDHGFLGIRYVLHHGEVVIDTVIPGTPAEVVGLQRGDHVVSVDGFAIRSMDDLSDRIYGSHPGARPEIGIARDGRFAALHPTLIAWPTGHDRDDY